MRTTRNEARTSSWPALTELAAPQAYWPALYVLAYVALDWVSYVHPVSPLGITPWNPAAGLSLFFLLRTDLRYWPLLIVAPLMADIIVRGMPAGVWALLVSAAMIAGVYTGSAWLMTRRLMVRATLDSARDLAVFLLVVTVVTLVLAVSYVGFYTRLGTVPAEDFVGNVLKFWIGDLNGILVLTPALLYHTGADVRRRRLSRSDLLETGLQALAIGVALWVVFPVADEYEFRFRSLLFLPLIWVSARWGLKGATLALVTLQAGLIAAVQLVPYQTPTFVQLQFLMIALCVTGLILGAVVTQRVRVEARLQEKQAALNRALQLTAAGEMTSALAHELSQPLAALHRYIGACEVMSQVPAEHGSLLAETMRKAANEARRASDVVQRLRDFYRSGTVQAIRIEAEGIVEAAFQATAGRAEHLGISITLDVPRWLPAVLVDPMQVETVLQNLLNNSIDALAHNPPNARSIRVSVRHNGPLVLVAIRDSGPGVAREIVPRLFEPFTTTKADGMGMGLAISHSLIKANGGDLSLGETGASGACFVVTLPVADGAIPTL